MHPQSILFVPPPLPPLFWSRVVFSPTCWDWTGARNAKGYGHVDVQKRFHYVHRLVYAHTYGPFPDHLFVLHTCDRPACVRPSHLFLGTAATNAADMVAKGRQTNRPPLIGETNGRAKLTAHEIAAIRTLAKTPGVSITALARAFGVGRATIGHIVYGRTWVEIGVV